MGEKRSRIDRFPFIIPPYIWIPVFLLAFTCCGDEDDLVEITCSTFTEGGISGTRSGWSARTCIPGCTETLASQVGEGEEAVFIVMDMAVNQGEADITITAPDDSVLWSDSFQPGDSEILCLKREAPQAGIYRVELDGASYEGKLWLYVFDATGRNITSPPP
jgi:hypothetical protein